MVYLIAVTVGFIFGGIIVSVVKKKHTHEWEYFDIYTVDTYFSGPYGITSDRPTRRDKWYLNRKCAECNQIERNLRCHPKQQDKWNTVNKGKTQKEEHDVSES